MAAIQSTDQIQTILDRLHGEEIAALQVVGINSLKSLPRMADALAGKTIETTTVADRLVTVITARHQVVFDLQRTGKLVWLDNAEPYLIFAGASRPTVRLLLTSGEGLDLAEPAKTKRVTDHLDAGVRAQIGDRGACIGDLRGATLKPEPSAPLQGDP